jgi:hypothetical protein
LPAVAVQCDHLTIQDELLDGEFFPDPIAELLEVLEDVPPL